jgi:hypothetical protein
LHTYATGVLGLVAMDLFYWKATTRLPQISKLRPILKWSITTQMEPKLDVVTADGVWWLSPKATANQEQNYFHSNRWFASRNIETDGWFLQMIDVNEVKSVLITFS